MGVDGCALVCGSMLVKLHLQPHKWAQVGSAVSNTNTIMYVLHMVTARTHRLRPISTATTALATRCCDVTVVQERCFPPQFSFANVDLPFALYFM